MRNQQMPLLVSVLAVLAFPGSAATGTPESGTNDPAICQPPPYPGPAVLLDLSLYKEGHPGTRVIDYGQRSAPDELRQALGIECRVLHDTAPVAQWIARPPPKGQVAGSIPARGTKFPL